MFIIIDSNTVISAVLNKGNLLNIFIKNFSERKFKFIAPNFLILEVGKHTEKIAKMTKFSNEEVFEILEFVFGQITFIPDEYFKNYLEEAGEILKSHKKDSHYLALALAFNCNILSGDKTLRALIPDKVITPRELLERF